MTVVMTGETSAKRSLLDALAQRSAKVGVCGLGYVGLPLALSASRAGFEVLGFDIDPHKVAQLNAGTSYLGTVSDDELNRVLDGFDFSASGDLGRIGECDIVTISVPTPLTRHREPDLSYVIKTVQAVASNLRVGQLVVLESTTYPGTTSEVVKPILEETGLRCGRDFFLGFAPEREDPGSGGHSSATIPRVVSGDGDDAVQLVSAFYSTFAPSVVPVSSMETAEAVKITENVFRAVNIALVNELKVIYESCGVDIWEVIEAAKTKPFGFMPFYPGPGLGGHCIPIDPFYLTWKAREHGLATRFIELAGEINTLMPQHVLNRLDEALDRYAGKSLSKARILVIGAAYKKNVSDIRESPALKLMELIERRGGTTSYHDPLVGEITATRDYPQLDGRKSVELTASNVAAHDALLIVTDHDEIDYPLLARAKIIVDTRNACARFVVKGPVVVKA